MLQSVHAVYMLSSNALTTATGGIPRTLARATGVRKKPYTKHAFAGLNEVLETVSPAEVAKLGLYTQIK